MPKKVITYGKTARDRKRERDLAEQKAAKPVRPSAPVEEKPAEPAEPIAEATATEQPAAPKKRNVRSIVIGATCIVLSIVLIVTGVLLMLAHRYPTDNAYATVTLEFDGKTYAIEYEIDGHGSDTATVRKAADNFVSQAVAGVYADTVFHAYRGGCIEGGKYVSYIRSETSGSARTVSVLSDTRFKARHYSLTGPSSAEIFDALPENFNDGCYKLYAVPHTTSDTSTPSGSSYRAGFGIVLGDTGARGQVKGAPIGVATAKGVTVLKAFADALFEHYPDSESFVDFEPIRLVGVSVKGNLFRKWEKYDFFDHYKKDTDYTMR